MDRLLSKRSLSPQEAYPTHTPDSEATFTEAISVEPLPPQPTQASSLLPSSHQETCPKCNSRLGPPLKSSGRQICIKCGWTDKPKGAISSQRDEVPRAASASVSLPDYELRKLLDQAASESLNNMKPKRKQTPSSNKNKPLPLDDGE
ncbi:hypothetical protein H6G00_30170 [Leptolyngbya sp. FACHB-541]|uniref:hypothetical protein n=1 Tax=Leptolyngbya sp. FACHB-541 TaxID=2692810 RepID=UPI001683FE71|nr:hypothetical protein [Leptolyngbya sp. FACHB-541]MBD2000823.1 hypothetical protein [Leptolyngbya sp. FACHB-541]